MNRRTSTYAARRAGSMTRGHNNTSFVSSIKLGPVSNSIIILLMVTILGLMYLMQATKATAYDRSISEVDTKIAELETKKKDQEIESARLGSFKVIKNAPIAASMSEPSDVQYVRR